jgi:hypothetical protein
MTRPQLEHILRAAAAITGADRFVVIGSQAILGQHTDPPAQLIESMEADVFSLRSPDDAELIDGSIGEASPFHRTFGYYAHGVGEETAVLPPGWKERLVELRTPATGGATGLCLDVHDLAVAKLAAGREKDVAFVGALLRHRMADATTVRSRLLVTPLSDAERDRCFARLSNVDPDRGSRPSIG